MLSGRGDPRLGPREILDALRVWNDADRRPSEECTHNAQRARPERAQIKIETERSWERKKMFCEIATPGSPLRVVTSSEEALQHQAPPLTTGMDVVLRGLSFPCAPGSSLGFVL